MKEYKSNEQLIAYLISKNVVVNNQKDAINKIGKYGYYSVINSYKNNFKDADVITGDITDSKVKKEIIEIAKKRKVNMIVGGPPCQGFSLKGKNLGLDDPRNFLFLEYFELVS